MYIDIVTKTKDKEIQFMSNHTLNLYAFVFTLFPDHCSLFSFPLFFLTHPRIEKSLQYLSATPLLPPRLSIDLSPSLTGPGDIAKAELLSWSGKSIDFLMCFFLFWSQTVFDLVSLFKQTEQSLFPLSAVVVVF